MRTVAIERQGDEARREAARANEAAGMAHERAAALEREAAGLKAQAEADRLARVKLEKEIAPRSLSVDQQSALADALRPFAGMRLVIASSPMDGEALGIARQILASLETAGVVPVDMIGRMGHVAGFAFGIHLVGRDGNARNAGLLHAIHGALTSFGQAVEADRGNAAVPLLTYPGSDFPEARTAAVAIFVGTKPVPMMKK